jgi:fimbrial chaperone protein
MRGFWFGLSALLIGFAQGFAQDAVIDDEPAVEGPLPFDAVPADAVSPFGGLSILPTRIVLEPGATSGQVTLFNSGSQAITYRIEALELEALAEGGYRPVVEGDVPDWSASRWLRYAPRQVTLGPNERQVIKIIARAPRDVAPGEYRSHLRFSSIPVVEPVKEGAPDEGNDETERSVAVTVGLEYRITIPVLLRLGELEGGAKINTARIETDPETGEARALITLSRTGQRSDYGVVRVTDASGAEVGLLRGVAILPPLDRRTVAIPFRPDAQLPLRISYQIEDRQGQTGRTLAEAFVSDLIR